MIQNNVLIRERNIRSRKLSQGSYDPGRTEIPFGVVVTAHDENSRMVPLKLSNQEVQVEKIAMVACNQRTIFDGRMSEVNRIILARETDIYWELHIVAGLLQ